jgi:hypothetical protein
MLKATLTCLLIIISKVTWTKQPALRVVTEEFIPYQYVGTDNIPTGLSISLINQILEKAEFTVGIELLPWARAYKAAQREKNVLIFSIGKSESRIKKFDWIGPLFQLGKSSLVTLKSREDIQVQSFEELKKYRVCSELNGWSYEFLLKKGFQENINLFNLRGSLSFLNSKNWALKQEADSVQLLQSSVCDVIERTNIDNDFEKLGLKILLPLRRNPLVLYAAVSLDSDIEIKNRIQNSYNSLIESGVLYKNCLREKPSFSSHLTCKVIKP